MIMKKAIQNGYMVITIAEPKLTSLLSNELRDKLVNLIDDGNYKLVLDLHTVEFMDSSALASIIAANNHLKSTTDKLEESGEFRVSGLTKNVKSLFSLLRINDIISVYDSVENAIN